MKKYTLTLLFAGLLTFSFTSFAQFIPANLYNCNGKDVTANFSSSSFAGQPLLNVTLGTQTFSAKGDAIKMEMTVLGNLMTLVKTATPDLYTETATLLLPDVNVTELGAQVKFKTKLITTRTNTTIAGASLVKGVIQQNSVTSLICTATAVVF